jgi:uncharacterized protein
MIDEAKIARAIESLRQAVPQGSRIILFGSCAYGGLNPDSDIDLLVIEQGVPDRFREMVRLRRAIGRIGVPVDVLVVSNTDFDYWKDTPTTVYYEAATKGVEYAAVA